MNITCDAPGCIRGLVHRGEWADPCKLCAGWGFLTITQLANLIGENWGTLRKVSIARHKMRPKTAFRILEKIDGLMSSLR